MLFLQTILQKLKDLTMAKIKHIATITGLVLLALLGYRLWQKHAKKVDQNTLSTVLQPDQKQKAIIDPIKHELTTVTRDKNGKEVTHKTYLPDRPIAIVENNDGKITIESRKWGPEFRPYFGAGFDGDVRLHLGADGLYFNKFDLGGGFKFNPVELKDTRIDANISYNFYSHTSLALSIDNHKTIEGFIKLRF